MIVGIDLGTTNSLVAYFTENGPQIIPNRLGSRLTPSVVSVDEDGNVYVGETANERAGLYPDTVVRAFKRDMGTDREYILSGRKFRPEDLSSMVIRYLIEDAENFLGEKITEAVITVPAYFDENRRKATKRAGELAGITVERMISEPTAAAIAYGICDRTLDTKFLVFDLGGGTFDVSILELYHNILEVRAVAGDNYLGGEDFTDVLVRIFLNKTKLFVSDMTSRERARLYREAEKAKKEFAESKEVTVSILFRDSTISETISYHEYEKGCEEILDKIRGPVKRALSDANLNMSDIDDLILIGGATRLEIVRTFLIKLFKKFPRMDLNPDETVALGAAISAAMKERREEVKEVILTDVCSYTLGTEVSEEYAENKFESGHYLPIIERNTTIPASHTQRLYTLRDNQEKIRVRILQGESRYAKNNLLLGEISINVPPGPAGSESVDVTYTYDINSLLEVIVRVISTGVTERMIIKGSDNRMTDEEIEARINELAYLKISPRDEEENKLLLLRAERMYEESLGDRRILIDRYLMEFELVLNSQNKDEIARARKKLTQFLDRVETDR